MSFLFGGINIVDKKIINCLNCNIEVVTNNGKREKKYCSRKCYLEFKKQKFITKNCIICNKAFIVPESQSHKYSTCSKECSKIYQIQLKESRKNGIYHKCEYCGKEYYVTKSISEHKIKKTRFCSMICRNKWESEFKCGENHHNFGIKYSKEKRKKMSITTVKLYENGVYNKQTIPQKIVNEILYKNNINFINEKGFKYYLIDNYLLDYNLAIEVNGDYFHANPLKFSIIKNKIQKNNIIRDKRKRTYLKKYGKFDILYLWESDIKERTDLCKKLITNYINNNGKLNNYQSFNYNIINEELVLNKDLIIPYIDLSAKEINILYNT